MSFESFRNRIINLACANNYSADSITFENDIESGKFSAFIDGVTIIMRPSSQGIATFRYGSGHQLMGKI